MDRRKARAFAFISGALIYPLTELIWRGKTHWSMSLLGGACFDLYFGMRGKHAKSSLISRCLKGTIIISASELAAGFVLNKIMKKNVWDYSKRKFNLCGQICPLFSLIWLAACVPLDLLCEGIEKICVK